MVDVSKLKQRRSLGAPPPPEEASANLVEPEVLSPRVEASSYSRLDGRSLRRSNRVVQFATRVTPEFDQRIRLLAQREGLLIVEVLERALDAYENVSTATHGK